MNKELKKYNGFYHVAVLKETSYGSSNIRVSVVKPSACYQFPVSVLLSASYSIFLRCFFFVIVTKTGLLVCGRKCGESFAALIKSKNKLETYHDMKNPTDLREGEGSLYLPEGAPM